MGILVKTPFMPRIFANKLFITFSNVLTASPSHETPLVATLLTSLLPGHPCSPNLVHICWQHMQSFHSKRITKLFISIYAFGSKRIFLENFLLMFDAHNAKQLIFSLLYLNILTCENVRVVG